MSRWFRNFRYFIGNVTLSELLIIIAIVGILVAVAVPAWQQKQDQDAAKAGASNVICVDSKLRLSDNTLIVHKSKAVRC